MENQSEENNLAPQKQLLGMLRAIKKPCLVRLTTIPKVSVKRTKGRLLLNFLP